MTTKNMTTIFNKKIRLQYLTKKIRLQYLTKKYDYNI